MSKDTSYRAGVSSAEKNGVTAAAAAATGATDTAAATDATVATGGVTAANAATEKGVALSDIQVLASHF